MTDLDDIRAAARLLDGVADRTPVQLSRALSHVCGAEVWLKCENLQRAGSFKLRGAYVRMARLSAEEKARGVVAASAGNHAQGVALAARMLGLTAVVFMPADAALPKIAATRDYGAHVELVGASVDEALVHAREYADHTGAVLIHPFDHEDVVAGQGTIALEIVEQVPDVATVLVPDRRRRAGGRCGRGVLAELRPDVRVIGVQAARAAAYPGSLAAGYPVAAPELRTMADGIAVGTPGTVPFGILASHDIEVRTVSEEDLSRALLLVAERAKMLVEPSGAAAVAALMAGIGPSRVRSWPSCRAGTSTRSSSCAWSGTGSPRRGGSCSCGSGSTTPRARSRTCCARSRTPAGTSCTSRTRARSATCTSTRSPSRSRWRPRVRTTASSSWTGCALRATASRTAEPQTRTRRHPRGDGASSWCRVSRRRASRP